MRASNTIKCTERATPRAIHLSVLLCGRGKRKEKCIGKIIAWVYQEREKCVWITPPQIETTSPSRPHITLPLLRISRHAAALPLPFASISASSPLLLTTTPWLPVSGASVPHDLGASWRRWIQRSWPTRLDRRGLWPPQRHSR